MKISEDSWVKFSSHKRPQMTRNKVLVTGATGFLGRRTVEMLVERGFQVRALVRTPSKAGNLAHLDVEVVQGDVADSESLEPAFEGIDYVVHAAADTSGTEEGARKVTIGGTRNILDLSASHQVRKLVYISSCSVYGSVDYKDGQMIDESTLLERLPEQRGIYSWAKLEAEKLVTEHMENGKAEIVCLRPGTIYGPRGEDFSPMLGYGLNNKIFIIIHKNGFIMPLVYIDNLVHAIITAMVQEKSAGQVYNVVDSQQIDKKEYIDKYIRKQYPDAWCIYVPYNLLSSLVSIQEKTFKTLRIKPFLSSYRLISSQKPVIYDSTKIMNHLGWQPEIPFQDAVERMMEYGKR